MIADFMTYRGIAMMVARLSDAGNWPLLVTAAVQSITQDYSWAPGLVPGLLLAATEPASRAIYSFALLALYAVPAAFALAVLARDCARRAGLARDASPAVLALGAAAAFAAYPAAYCGRRARHARCRRARAGCLRAQAGRTPRAPARAAPGLRRAR